MRNRTLTVRSLAYDKSLRREWTAELISQTSSRIDLVGVFESTVEHRDLGRIAAGTVSYEFYWPDRWYNIFRFEYPDGGLRNYYCNVAMPPAISETALEYVDLDIDVLVWPDREPIVLDRDEFEENRRALSYPEEVVAKAEETLKELLNVDSLTSLFV
ncbi:MAG: DUF402 domain-containing protein [Acidobacteria bacterium ACB1]|nr:hypothetical protein [Pyrinomonadaceae bacterium]MCE7963663.1 DUF402 domain-containing protein [Acidobacteria bacterium ACB1]